MAWLGRPVWFSVICITSWGALGGCGTNATGVDACRRIEQARCRQAPACPSLGIPAGDAVEQCVQFARDRCLHGLAVADPGPAVVDPCVHALESTTSCDILAAPVKAPACAFLSSVSDGGTDDVNAETSIVDSATDATADAASQASADAGTDTSADAASLEGPAISDAADASSGDGD